MNFYFESVKVKMISLFLLLAFPRKVTIKVQNVIIFSHLSSVPSEHVKVRNQSQKLNILNQSMTIQIIWNICRDSMTLSQIANHICSGRVSIWNSQTNSFTQICVKLKRNSTAQLYNRTLFWNAFQYVRPFQWKILRKRSLVIR